MRAGVDEDVVMLRSGDERFTVDDLYALSDQVASAWTSAADRDWSAAAGSLEWSCTRTADHAVDCVYAPAFFLASRMTDDYPAIGLDLTLGAEATPVRLVEHTRPSPLWTIVWHGLSCTDDPWGDLLAASGRARRAERNPGA